MLIDGVHAAVERALDVRFQRHELLASNIANADTPGYIPRDVPFDGALKEALEAKSGDNAAASAPDATHATAEVLDRPEVFDSLDDNAVDTDKELARLADNSMRYQATLELARRRYAMIRQTISDMQRS